MVEVRQVRYHDRVTQKTTLPLVSVSPPSASWHGWTADAHGLVPRRRVFVTINTLIRQDELPELIDALAALTEIGVDAIILQDLGVYRALRQHFPTLELHGSTQMAVHNRAGAEVLDR